MIVLFKDVLRLLLALEEIEEGVARDRLNNDALLASLLVLLRLFNFLFGGVLALFPVDDCAFDLDSLVRIVVHYGSEADRLVCKELVFTEFHSYSELRKKKLALRIPTAAPIMMSDTTTNYGRLTVNTNYFSVG